ncbi:hypothetical protein FHR32_003339 [Streptosporangium album]|uniref:Uncharacterized protein n=1 Tax=Streptosporangium album TaxID=47479 RepID=A0A7W7RVJ9_9ACTN|nr:hypothetical protein [Streptosporangium album]
MTGEQEPILSTGAAFTVCAAYAALPLGLALPLTRRPR